VAIIGGYEDLKRIHPVVFGPDFLAASSTHLDGNYIACRTLPLPAATEFRRGTPN
jgi:hypothetical protein